MPNDTPPAARDPYAKLKGADKTGKVLRGSTSNRRRRTKR